MTDNIPSATDLSLDACPECHLIAAERDRYRTELERIYNQNTVLIGNPYRSAIRSVLAGER